MTLITPDHKEQVDMSLFRIFRTQYSLSGFLTIGLGFCVLAVLPGLFLYELLFMHLAFFGPPAAWLALRWRAVLKNGHEVPGRISALSRDGYGRHVYLFYVYSVDGREFEAKAWISGVAARKVDLYEGLHTAVLVHPENPRRALPKLLFVV